MALRTFCWCAVLVFSLSGVANADTVTLVDEEIGTLFTPNTVSLGFGAIGDGDGTGGTLTLEFFGDFSFPAGEFLTVDYTAGAVSDTEIVGDNIPGTSLTWGLNQFASDQGGGDYILVALFTRTVTAAEIAAGISVDIKPSNLVANLTNSPDEFARITLQYEAVPIPEPGTIALFSLGIGLAVRRRHTSTGRP